MNDKEFYILIGAGGQIGHELTKRLALRNANCQILAIDKNFDPNHQTPQNVITVKEDVKTLNLIDMLGDKIINASNVRFIYNAAVSFFSPLKTRTRDELNETFEVNIASAISCYKSFLTIREKLKIEKKETSAIFTGSVYGVVSPDFRIYSDGDRRNSECYGASKAALIQAVKYFASSFPETFVRVNTVSPGGVYNPENPQAKDFISNYCDRVPMGRMANTHEIVRVIEFILLEASYINGQNIIVDGGLTAW